MFQQLQHLETAFQYVKRLSFAALALSFLLMLYALWTVQKSAEESASKVYVLAWDKLLEAQASPRAAFLDVELRDHVRMFHFHFFSLSPDEKAINRQLEKALYLADRSAKETIDNLREKGYFSQLVASNIHQELIPDSVVVDTSVYPYHFSYYGKQRIERSSSIVIRSLITEGRLREVQKSDNNPHGFLIQNWKTIENLDLEVIKR